MIKFIIAFALFFPFIFVNAASLYFSPSTKTVNGGDTFSVDVMVDTQGEQVNAVGAYFIYPAQVLQVVDIQENDTSTDPDSVFDLFVPEDATPGSVRVNGGSFAPGFAGVHRVAKVTFRVLSSAGNSVLAIASDAVVLRNSDSGDVLATRGTASIRVGSSSPTPTNQPTATPVPTAQPSTAPAPTVASQDFITSVDVRNVSDNSVTITWSTKEPTISKIAYGSTQQLGTVLLNGKSTASHEIHLTNLAKKQLHYFEITARDSNGLVHKTSQLPFATNSVQIDPNGNDAPDTPSDSASFFDRIPGGIIALLAILIFVMAAAFLLILLVKK